MYRLLLLAVTLGAVAMLPASASAHGHAPVPPNVVSSLDFRIVLHDGPRFVHHRHPPRGHFRPQPWSSKFKQYAPRPRWHAPRQDRTRHFWSRDNDYRHWSRDSDHQRHWFPDNDHRRRFKHARPKSWVHGPARHPGRHDGFKHRRHRSGSHH
jgi:hypothetical protein